jgi:hypothetical protein
MSANAMSRGRTRHDEQAVQLWQDWRRYLVARATLLDLRLAPTDTDAAGFEQGDDSPAERERGARSQIAAIPAAYRLVCDQRVEARRQQLQSEREQAAREQAAGNRPEVVDPDVVERDVLQQLLDEADGRATRPGLPAGWGLVPSGDGDQVWGVNVPQIRSAPGRAAYELGGDDDLDVRRRLIQVALLFAAAAVTLLIWFIWPKGEIGPRVADGVVSPVVNSRAVPVWGLRQMTLSQSNGEATTLPISTTLRLDPWPGVTTGVTNTAFARQSPSWPLEICVPDQLLEGLASVQVDGLREAPNRVYTIVPVAERPDLVVEPCQTAPGVTTTRYGSLQAIVPPAFLALGEAAPVPASNGAAVTLASAQILGPGQSPTLPDGRAEVILDVALTGSVELPGLAPVLLLPSGEVAQTTFDAVTAERASLRYSVPLPATSLELVWQLSLPDGSLARWRFTQEPPPSRELLVWRSVALGTVSASPDALGATVLHITLENRGEVPLQLSTADIRLAQGSTALPIGELAGLQTPLEPGEARTIDVPLPPQAGRSPLVLTVGGTRARIDLAQEGR